MIAKFSKKRLVKDILREGRVLGLHEGATRIIAEKVAEKVEKWTKKRATVTELDISRVATKELIKYNPDLAYVYENRDKII